MQYLVLSVSHFVVSKQAPYPLGPLILFNEVFKNILTTPYTIEQWGSQYVNRSIDANGMQGCLISCIYIYCT